jgi:hypothetical protein
MAVRREWTGVDGVHAPPARARATPPAPALLALQRQAGNRAVGRLLRDIDPLLLTTAPPHWNPIATAWFGVRSYVGLTDRERPIPHRVDNPGGWRAVDAAAFQMSAAQFRQLPLERRRAIIHWAIPATRSPMFFRLTDFYLDAETNPGRPDELRLSVADMHSEPTYIDLLDPERPLHVEIDTLRAQAMALPSGSERGAAVHSTCSGANNTLGNFTVHLDGQLRAYRPRATLPDAATLGLDNILVQFSGTMTWEDYWDFDARPVSPDSRRPVNAETQVRIFAGASNGRPFRVTSEPANLVQQVGEPAFGWDLPGWWARTSR